MIWPIIFNRIVSLCDVACFSGRRQPGKTQPEFRWGPMGHASTQTTTHSEVRPSPSPSSSSSPSPSGLLRVMALLLFTDHSVRCDVTEGVVAVQYTGAFGWISGMLRMRVWVEINIVLMSVMSSWLQCVNLSVCRAQCHTKSCCCKQISVSLFCYSHRDLYTLVYMFHVTVMFPIKVLRFMTKLSCMPVRMLIN